MMIYLSEWPTVRQTEFGLQVSKAIYMSPVSETMRGSFLFGRRQIPLSLLGNDGGGLSGLLPPADTKKARRHSPARLQIG